MVYHNIINLSTTIKSISIVKFDSRCPFCLLREYATTTTITMGCKLSIHLANPQEEALHTEVAALRKTVLDLQTVVRALEKDTADKSKKAPQVRLRSTNTALNNNHAIESPSKSISSTPVNDITAPEEKSLVGTQGCRDDAAEVTVTEIAEETLLLQEDTAEGFIPPLPELRVPLKPTEIVANLLRAAHLAESNTLDYLLTDNHADSETWRAYQTFRRQYDRLLHGTSEIGTSSNDNKEGRNGGLLHFLGLPEDQLSLDEKHNLEEATNIKAIAESLDWRDDTKEALARYRDSRIAHADRLEDAVLPRLEALQAAADKDNTNGDEEDGEELGEMTRNVLFMHVLHPFVADTSALETFVRYVTRALERTGPNKSAIRPFQNAIKAMAQTTEQSEEWKSWITHTRRTGVLTEKAVAKKRTASEGQPLQVGDDPQEIPEKEDPVLETEPSETEKTVQEVSKETVPSEDAPKEQPPPEQAQPVSA